jgi:hypothetical protein
VREYVDKDLVTHEFIKRLHKRYKQEGIIFEPLVARGIRATDQKALERRDNEFPFEKCNS